jgi:hypothetical protein
LNSHIFILAYNHRHVIVGIVMSIKGRSIKNLYSNKNLVLFVLAFYTFSVIFPSINSNTVKADGGTPVFPVIGSAYFSNDFNAARSNGLHRATDIFAPKMSPIISPVSGTVYYVMSPQPSWGYSVGIRDAAGTEYKFIHMNNDTPGTDDGAGTEMTAYAADMKVGNRVEKGQLLGYVGDSGNAETTPSHLHFEIYDQAGNAVNPYDHLIRWNHTGNASLYPPLSGETLPYWVAYTGGVNIAMGDMNGDGQSELATIAGEGGSPIVKTYAGINNTFLGEFAAYDPGFKGGGDIALGDVTGDGIDEIVTVPGAGGGPWVKIFNTNAQLLGEFAAYDPGFKGGVKIALGDVTGDGIDEIITGPGAGGGPWVRVFNSQAQLLYEFAAYDPGFKGGIDVAAADTVDSIAKEIVTGPGAGGGPWVRVFKPTAQLVKEFPVYDQTYTGGIRVSGGNVRSNSTKDELMTIPAAYGESRVRLMKNTGENIRDYVYLESWWKGYYDVAAGEGRSQMATGVNRRGSMRPGPN